MILIQRGLPRPVYYLAAATFANSLGTFLLPFLPLYLTSLGIADDATGLVVASYGLGCLISSVGGGWLSDRVGRKPVILINLFLSAVLTACIGFIANLAVLTTFVFAIGCCAGLSRPASSALVGDLVSDEEAASAYGMLYWAGNVGFLAASLVGGFIATQSFVLLFLFDSATCLAAFVLLLRGLVLSRDEQVPVQQSTAMPTTRHSMPLIFIIGITFVSWLIQTQAWAALPLTVTSHGHNAFDWGLLSATNGAVVIISQPWANTLIKRWGTSRSLGTGCLILGLGFSVTPVLATLPAFIVQTVLWSLGEVLVSTASPAAVSHLTTPENRGRWMGYSAAAFSLASILSPATGGYALETGQDILLWATCGALGALGFTFSLSLSRAAERRGENRYGA